MAGTFVYASAMWRDLLHGHSVLIRDFSRAPGLENCLRVTVGAPDENKRFLDAVGEVLAARRAGRADAEANAAMSGPKE